MSRRRLLVGKSKCSQFVVIQNWADFPVTWSGVKKGWSEMSPGPGRTAAISGMAVVALVVVFN
ncbi:MAG: hypothetical protein Ct9H300mP16_07250 [Pseudomonadota bacterium]|nr:MAG: hypothetical protein Ct9H300mP16_07250 [Pseudomonadota bacterium]